MPFAFFMYNSRAPVMEGALGNGASISRIKPASRTALAVVGPNTAIRVLFCLNSGKLTNKRIYTGGAKERKNIVKHFFQIGKIGGDRVIDNSLLYNCILRLSKNQVYRSCEYRNMGKDTFRFYASSKSPKDPAPF